MPPVRDVLGAPNDELSQIFFRKREIELNGVEGLAASAIRAASFSLFDDSMVRDAIITAYDAGFDMTSQLAQDVKAEKTTPLWSTMPSSMRRTWDNVVEVMRKDAVDWSFWIEWYERVLAGENWHPEELVPILNNITAADWEQGPGHINPKFDAVQARYQAEGEFSKGPAPEVETTGKSEAVSRTKAAMIRHRSTLPPTFDDILDYAAQEVANLQKSNWNSRSDEEQAFVKRQIEVIKTIHLAVAGLRDLVPTGETMADADAVRAHGLLQQIVGRLKAWPSLQGQDGRTNLERTVDQSMEGTIGVAGKATKAALFAGVGYVLLMFFGPQVAAGAFGLAFGRDAMVGLKEMIEAKDEKS